MESNQQNEGKKKQRKEKGKKIHPTQNYNNTRIRISFKESYTT